MPYIMHGIVRLFCALHISACTLLLKVKGILGHKLHQMALISGSLPQPDSNSDCMTTDMGPLHHVVCLYNPRLSPLSNLVLLSSRKVLVLEEQFTSPCPRTSSPCPCPWPIKSLKIAKVFVFCKQSVMYDHMKSINSVCATLH